MLPDSEFLEEEANSEKSQKAEDIFYCSTVVSNIPALIQSAVAGPGLSNLLLIKDVLLSGYSTISYCRSILSVNVGSEECRKTFVYTLGVMEDLQLKIKSLKLDDLTVIFGQMKQGFQKIYLKCVRVDEESLKKKKLNF